MVHIHHRKKTPGGCIERLARSGSCRESVLGVVGPMNGARSRPDWLATVQSGRKHGREYVGRALPDDVAADVDCRGGSLASFPLRSIESCVSGVSFYRN